MLTHTHTRVHLEELRRLARGGGGDGGGRSGVSAPTARHRLAAQVSGARVPGLGHVNPHPHEGTPWTAAQACARQRRRWWRARRRRRTCCAAPPGGARARPAWPRPPPSRIWRRAPPDALRDVLHHHAMIRGVLVVHTLSRVSPSAARPAISAKPFPFLCHISVLYPRRYPCKALPDCTACDDSASRVICRGMLSRIVHV